MPIIIYRYVPIWSLYVHLYISMHRDLKIIPGVIPHFASQTPTHHEIKLSYKFFLVVLKVRDIILRITTAHSISPVFCLLYTWTFLYTFLDLLNITRMHMYTMQSHESSFYLHFPSLSQILYKTYLDRPG